MTVKISGSTERRILVKNAQTIDEVIETATFFGFHFHEFDLIDNGVEKRVFANNCFYTFPAAKKLGLVLDSQGLAVIQ